MPTVPSLVDDTIVTDAENSALPGDEFLRAVPFDPDGPTHAGCTPFPGERIGRYELQDKLAQGAFGRVFRARDLELDRVVALKVLDPDHVDKHEIVRRFLQEARAAARVVHPNVITILDCGQYDGGAYIAMDLLDGESLTDRLADCGRFLAHDAVEIARQIAAALEAAHAAGVLHRDLKPDNIFLVKDPTMRDGLRVKLIDFGLAKVELDAPSSRRRTGTQSVFGTPRYMSPEQCRSSTRIDHRSDIYALGCILFELVTGAPPYDGELDAVIEAHLTAPIPRASTFCSCPPTLDELIVRLLAKDPVRRPPTMTAVRRALDTLPLGRLGSTPSTPPPRPPVAALPRIMRPVHARGTPPPPPPPAVHKLPPYYPKPPTLASASNRTPPTPVPINPSMSTAMAMSMAYVPATMTSVPVVVPITPGAMRAVVTAQLPAATSKAPSLAHAVAVPIGLPSPLLTTGDERALQPPPASMWPLVVVAIACALSGVLAALLFV